ncbi:MAG: hypothetical protein IKQ46_10655 [Bacteroidales bacterium]|nr:hypothetical protein [Bacteroidales bacterium]
MEKRGIRVVMYVAAIVLFIILVFAAGVITRATRGSGFNQTILIVKSELETAEKLLIEKDRELFETYKNNPFSENGHEAEKLLRERYPMEYGRYVEAKGYLDDLYYTKFMVVTNSLSKGDK